MTDADLDFTLTTKPTPAQVRFVWNSMAAPSARKVVKELEKRGGKIAFKTVLRWKDCDWQPRPRLRTKASQGQIRTPRSGPEIKEAAAAASLIGGALPETEMAALQRDMAELGALDMPALKTLQEKERLVFNIMIMRAGQRKSHVLALIPKDVAALIQSTTDARDSLSMIPPGEPNTSLVPAGNGHANGNGHYLDVTPSNPISDAIAVFKRKQGAAA